MLLIPYIKKDVNKALLLLIIVLLVLYSWSSIYYDNKLKNISAQFQLEQDELQAATGNLILEKDNETINLQESFQEDKEVLEKGYSDLNAENQDLTKNNTELKTELDSVKSELEEYKSKFSILEKRFNEIQDASIKINEDISRLASRNRYLCSKLKAANPEEEC